MADDSDSALSSAPPTEDEMPVPEPAPKSKSKSKSKTKSKKNSTILTFFNKRDASPARRKRPASPPHEYVPEDNPDIAFIVMFRSRFAEAFPRGAPHVGPQDIELGVVDGSPSQDVEGLLCALLGLVLNRKKPVEKGHYGRALEEAIQTQRSQWPRRWNYVNPLNGARSFNTMTAVERIGLLHTLCLWALNQNEIVKGMIAAGYKSRTTKDRLDTNIPLSVQPWGRDGEKRRYWLIEGQNDTHFRVYRETNPGTPNVAWWSVAGSIDELRTLAKTLDEEDGAKDAKSLSERMLNACPRFEASEVKRKRREYRQSRSAFFSRPEPGFSLYEGRTRGKRLRYTFSDGEDASDDAPVRRSGRTSRDSPAPAAPTVTSSGRQVRSRATGMYGETLLSGQTGDAEPSDVSEEPRRSGLRGRQSVEEDSDDATSWDGDDDGDVDDGDADDESDEEPQSLVVTLHYKRSKEELGTEQSEKADEQVEGKTEEQQVEVNGKPDIMDIDAPIDLPTQPPSSKVDDGEEVSERIGQLGMRESSC